MTGEQLILTFMIGAVILCFMVWAVMPGEDE